MSDYPGLKESAAIKKAAVSRVQAAPAIINGSVDITAASPNGSWATVVTGNGLTPAQRKTNAASMQAAINYAMANRKFIVVPPAEYEIDNTAGLVITNGGGQGRTRWMGSPYARIWQFHTNTPVLTIGDVNGQNGDEDHIVDGFSLLYGADQTGQVNSSALVLGFMWKSSVSNGRVDASISAHLPFRCCYIPSTGGDFFSNSVRDMVFRGCQNTNFFMNSGTTGSVFQNIYCSNVGVGGSPGSVSYGVFVMDKGGGSFGDGVIDQLNCEWTRADRIVRLNNCQGLEIHGLHLEGNHLTGNGGGFIEQLNGGISLRGVMVENCHVTTAEGYLANAASLVWSYAGDTEIENLRFRYDGAGLINVPIYLVTNGLGAADPDWHNNVNVTNVRVDDNVGPYVYPDDNLSPGLGYAPVRTIGRYTVADPFSFCEGAVQIVPDADYTYYGGYDRGRLDILPNLTANRTVVLSDKLCPSGVGSTTTRTPGDTVTVKRAAYYGSVGTVSAFTVTIKNINSGGTTLATLAPSTASGATFRFDGSNWELVS